MADGSKPKSFQSLFRLLTTSTIGVTLLVLSGLSFTGACLVLIMATPTIDALWSNSSPRWDSLLIISGFFLSGGSGMAAITTLLWAYNYVSGKHPVGGDKLDDAMERIANKYREVQYKTQMYAQHGQYFFN